MTVEHATPPADATSAADDEERTSVGMALTIAGGGVVAVGVPLWIVGASKVEPSPSEQVSIVVGPGGFVLAGTF